MPVIEPIIGEQQHKVISETERYIRIAAKELSRPFELIPVLFDLTGQTAGMYKMIERGKNTQRIIRYNPWLFAKYWEDNFSTTIPHEVAHYITEQLYGRVPPHGAEWKEVMALFGADNNRTCSFDMDGIPQRSIAQFSYRCDCREHQLSIHRHNKIQRNGAHYLCKFCNGVLKLLLPV